MIRGDRTRFESWKIAGTFDPAGLAVWPLGSLARL